MNKTILTYDNQLEFKKFAFKNGLKRKYDFYFDDIDCVDTKTSSNIPKITCDDMLTFEKALKKLIEYFENKEKTEAKKAKREAKELVKKIRQPDIEVDSVQPIIEIDQPKKNENNSETSILENDMTDDTINRINDQDSDEIVDIDVRDSDEIADEIIDEENGIDDDNEFEEEEEDRRFDDETDEDKVDYRREYYEDDDMLADFEQ